MKNAMFTFLALVIFSLNVSAQADGYRFFELDFGLNLANPLKNEFISEGNPLYLEPRFNISDRVSAGIRWEGTNIENTDSGLESKLEARLFTVDYYLPGKTRFFIGSGIGRYFLEDVPETRRVSKFGVAPRIGVELGHFRAGLTYNYVSGDSVEGPDYIGVNIGLVLWGGKK